MAKKVSEDADGAAAELFETRYQTHGHSNGKDLNGMPRHSHAILYLWLGMPLMWVLGWPEGAHHHCTPSLS